MTETTTTAPADHAAHKLTVEELPYEGTVATFRAMVAEQAAEAEQVWRGQRDAEGRAVIPRTPEGRVAGTATLYAWATAALIRWAGETYGADAAYDAAEIVQHMQVNGGGDWIDDLDPSLAHSGEVLLWSVDRQQWVHRNRQGWTDDPNNAVRMGAEYAKTARWHLGQRDHGRHVAVAAPPRTWPVGADVLADLRERVAVAVAEDAATEAPDGR